jgi:crotonobetainyl-CoA:carnitine CoA-transferase CaiB-like acyl-CoA transferase
VRRGAPRLGEHNDELLREAGYDDAQIAALKAKKVISEAPPRS